MAVDLSQGSCGIVAFATSPKARFFAVVVEERGDDRYAIRWEDGWYKTYRRDGTGLVSGQVYDRNGKFVENTKAADCIEFIPCEIDDPRAAGLPTSSTP
jgi:hypothetical protein